MSDLMPPYWRGVLNPNDEVNGVLFIGDPHVWSRKPVRRLDEDFLGSVLGKLEAAAEIANTNNLQPIVLGDLFERQDDNNIAMLTRLLRVLKKFDRVPLCISGNHDRHELSLTDNHPLQLLNVSKWLRVMDAPGESWIIRTRTGNILVGATPYGNQLGKDLPRLLGLSLHENIKTSQDIQEWSKGWLSDQGVEGGVCWLTHGDFGFSGCPPGSVPLFEVPGVDIIVNGHLHGTAPDEYHGTTHWFNPGNITRMSIALMDHVPKVWSWAPRDPLLRGWVLPHRPGKEIFDLTGKLTTWGQTAQVQPVEESETEVPVAGEEGAETVSTLPLTNKFVSSYENEMQNEFNPESLGKMIDEMAPELKSPPVVVALLKRLLSDAEGKPS